MTAFQAYRVFNEDGGIHGRVVDATLDDLSAGEVVVKAAFSSVNYKDALAATTDRIIRSFPRVIGIDVSGTVESSGDARFAAGDQVLATGYELGVTHDGGYSQYVRVPADWLVPVPPGLSAFDVMAIGTAGFTAALSIRELERNGLTPGRGPVLVTGATGGVGSMAVRCLARLGYQVTALTGKDGEHDYLRALGASQVVSRSIAQPSGKPIDKATWAAAVDSVGGEMLAWVLRTMAYRGAVAASGLTGGIEVKTSVIPFILRGVKLLGIDSVMCPMDDRLETWRRLAGDMKPADLDGSATAIGLQDLDDAFATLLKGGAVGRYVVKL